MTIPTLEEQAAAVRAAIRHIAVIESIREQAADPRMVRGLIAAAESLEEGARRLPWMLEVAAERLKLLAAVPEGEA